MTYSELHRLYHQPLFDLLDQARAVHRANWPANEVQLCTLLSIKTGGCSEDCAYCAQSARYDTGVKAQRLMTRDEVLERAQVARAGGATRFCMGAAWRGVRGGTQRFDEVLGIVRAVSALGIEVCTTLGELGAEEARQLKEAGVTAYNHNIDTSPEHYPKIVTTHRFEDRLRTIRHVQEAGISLCCGGILGLGETIDDRLRMLEVLVSFDPPPESVPLNSLMPMPGTPLADNSPVDAFDLVRLVAVTRLALPKAKVRLSAGRTTLSREAQALCFFAGANSIFYGEKLLTAPNPRQNTDLELLRDLGLEAEPPKCEVAASAHDPAGPPTPDIEREPQARRNQPCALA
jgi:biotin synthase